MAKFELNRLLEYSDQAIVDEIKRVAGQLNAITLTGKAFDEVSKVSRGLVNRRFGSWKAALEAAGLGHLYSGQVVTPQMRTQLNRTKSNEDLLQILREISSQLGRTDISTSDLTKDGRVNRDVFASRFGSWKKAIELAGLRLREPGVARRVFSDEQLFSNLRETWERFGRQPYYSEMNHPPSTIKSKTYWNRFGTWRKALLAFVESVERSATADDKIDDAEAVARPGIVTALTDPSSGKSGQTRDRRSISLGLRFRVLYRDNFKCVLCGNSPPVSPGLVLHVDHVIPWSRGGKTELENLRTLCAACNLGRGNSYAE